MALFHPEVPSDSADSECTDDGTPVNLTGRKTFESEHPETTSTRKQGRVYRLQPAVKQRVCRVRRRRRGSILEVSPTFVRARYAWGIRGGDSRVARYGLEAGTHKAIDQSAPCEAAAPPLPPPSAPWFEFDLI